MIKRYLLIFVITIFAFASSCDIEVDSSTNSDSDYKCGTYNGHQLWTGPKGGCYYYNSNNNKTYVDRSYCNCK
jgi:hypothetical protein